MDKTTVVETTATEVAPVVNESIKTFSENGTQAAIIIGSAAAGIGAYLLLTKVVVPGVKGFIDNRRPKKIVVNPA